MRTHIFTRSRQHVMIRAYENSYRMQHQPETYGALAYWPDGKWMQVTGSHPTPAQAIAAARQVAKRY